MQNKKQAKLLKRAALAVIIAAIVLISSCKVIDTGNKESAETGDVSGSAVEDITDNKEIEKSASIVSHVVRNIAPVIECRDVSLSLAVVEGKTELCIHKNTFNIVVVNDGEKTISGIDLYIEGEKSGEILTRIKSGISIGSMARQIIMYDTERYGDVEKVRIVPLIKLDNGKDAECDVKEINEKDIRTCD